MKSGEGFRDNDSGMSEILKEMSSLSELKLKVGLFGTEEAESGGPTIVEYATWNEYGVPGPPYSENGGGIWFIPPRPFIRGWLDNEGELLKTVTEKLVKQLFYGKLSALEVAEFLGQFSQVGIKKYIREGRFVPNAERTKKGKRGSTKPLIDTDTMRNSIRYKVLKDDTQ